MRKTNKLLFPLALLLLPGVAAGQSPNPSAEAISAYADELGARYRVPAVLIKAVMEQESNWRQFQSSGAPLINYEPDGRQGIGLFQVTVPPRPRTVELQLATIDPDHPFGENLFSTNLAGEAVDVSRLETDWRYNMEVGVRILVAKRSTAGDADLDARVLETWYYALLYYNGAGANDPAGPYTRIVLSPGDWKSTAQFPYQECVYNIVAQLYPIPTERRRYFGDPIQVTLPGPADVASGAGRYRFVEPVFCLYDWADFHANGTAEMGGCGNGFGCIADCNRHSGLTVHAVELEPPVQTSLPTVTEDSYAAVVGRDLAIFSFPMQPRYAAFLSMRNELVYEWSVRPEGSSYALSLSAFRSGGATFSDEQDAQGRDIIYTRDIAVGTLDLWLYRSNGDADNVDYQAGRPVLSESGRSMDLDLIGPERVQMLFGHRPSHVTMTWHVAGGPEHSERVAVRYIDAGVSDR